MAAQGTKKPAVDFGGGNLKTRFAVQWQQRCSAGALTMAADGSWTGWISDSQCGVKGANDKAGTAECTTKCVKEHGAKYVFVNDADKKSLRIGRAGQGSRARRHHVTVKGSVDGETSS